jgi:UDP-4-amino-4,6-dideoxy-N-acetyl-beta-L-altrosamine N-acetyltransferase
VTFDLRPVREEDLPLILHWRNAPQVRQKMFTTHVIGEEEHRAHFARSRADDSKRSMLCLDDHDRPVGVVTFSDIDPVHGTATWGFYTGVDAPRGTGTRMLTRALEYAFGDLGLRKVSADVISSNEASVRVHRRLGFQLEGTFKEHRVTATGYVDVYRFALFEREWTGEWRRRTEEHLLRLARGA